MSIQQEVADLLRSEMDARGWHNNDWRAGLAAIIGGESNFIPKFETGYAHTSNDRIRMLFVSRMNSLSDEQLTELKASDRKFFNRIYGPQNAIGRGLGNTEPDDGYNFRGGGLNQLTGRGNYAKYGPRVGVDLIAHPELINTPRIAAAVAVEYMVDRFHGGDFDAMKRAVGVSIGEPDAEKNRLYKQYTQSGEWNYTGEVAAKPVLLTEPGQGVVLEVAVSNFLNSLHSLENFLKIQGLYTGPIDDDPGPGVRAGLKAYLKTVK